MRNKVGGNKAKKMGRKHTIVRDVALVVRTNDIEHYGYVDKIFGGRLCSAIDVSGKKYKIHIDDNDLHTYYLYAKYNKDYDEEKCIN